MDQEDYICKQWDSHQTFDRLRVQFFTKVLPAQKIHRISSTLSNRTICKLWEALQPFPVVHAEGNTENSSLFRDNLTENTSTKSSGTSMDKLCESRPQAVVTDGEIKTHIAQETGKERVMLLFSNMNNGEPHPNMQMIQMSIFQCSSIVFFVAGYFGGMDGKERFVAKNKHTKFDTKFQATRKYNDSILLNGMKTGLKYALKTGIFTGLFLSTAFSVSMYRNKTSPLDFIVAGGVTGGLFRMSMGLRGCLAGSVIGLTMGGVAGTIMWLVLWASDETQEKRHYWYTEGKLREKKQIQLLHK